MAVTLRWLIIPFCLLLRCTVSLFGYSGEGKPPMYGDYEAQRHWMELTVNLPIKEWYFNTSDNDLLYWGLDYPPLTAYHSYLCGVIANYINPEFVRLHTSRGYESPEHKLFMRYTVLVADLITFITAVYLYVRISAKDKNTGLWKIDSDVELLLILCYPGFILVDFGHFQYNSVSLGLALFSIIATKTNRRVLSCLSFCLALSYKQMILYYSLPIFCYYLGECKELLYKKGIKSSLTNFIKLSTTVILSIVLIWLPFLSSFQQIVQVLHRIFPFERGIFEDKVSNIWCVVNILIKFRLYLTNKEIAFICSLLTFSTSAFSFLNLFNYPTKEKYLFSLINTSLAFFLFSYQVHEKTILLPCLPVLLCFKFEPLHSFWFLIISTFSLLPLMIKDQLIIPFFGLTGVFIFSILAVSYTKEINFVNFKKMTFTMWTFVASLITALIITITTLIVEPPVKYPNLFPLIISVYSAMHFLYFLIYFTVCQLKMGKKFKHL